MPQTILISEYKEYVNELYEGVDLMNLHGDKEDNPSNQSVPDSSSSDKEAKCLVDRAEAVAGADGKVKADVGRKAQEGNSSNSGTRAARVVTETYTQVLKKPKRDHQNMDQDKAKRQ